MRQLTTHPHHYYYMRVNVNSPAFDGVQSDTAKRYEVVDIHDVSSHIESFAQHVQRVEASYSIDVHEKNADATLISALHESQFQQLNLNSIDDVRLAADVLKHEPSTLKYCYSSPAKSRFHIMEAISLGINRMTVSYPAEVLRISSVSKTVELVLQISPSEESSGAPREMSKRSGAPRCKWDDIIKTATKKGMRIIGIALGTQSIDTKQQLSEALSRAREAHDLVSELGHQITFVDLGSVICDYWQYSHPTRQRCSTIVEESNADGDDDCDSEYSFTSESSDQGSDDDILNSQLDLHLPRSIGLKIYAHHAAYQVPDEATLKQWWGMPKARRPAPSLHSYLVAGCSSKSAYMCAYRAKRRKHIVSHDVVNEHSPVAAQASTIIGL